MGRKLVDAEDCLQREHLSRMVVRHAFTSEITSKLPLGSQESLSFSVIEAGKQELSRLALWHDMEKKRSVPIQLNAVKMCLKSLSV